MHIVFFEFILEFSQISNASYYNSIISKYLGRKLLVKIIIFINYFYILEF